MAKLSPKIYNVPPPRSGAITWFMIGAPNEKRVFDCPLMPFITKTIDSDWPIPLSATAENTELLCTVTTVQLVPPMASVVVASGIKFEPKKKTVTFPCVEILCGDTECKYGGRLQSVDLLSW